jgi:hypothetical protein
LVNDRPPSRRWWHTGAAWPVNTAILIQIVLFGILREYSSNNKSIFKSISSHFTQNHTPVLAAAQDVCGKYGPNNRDGVKKCFSTARYYWVLGLAVQPSWLWSA